MEPIDAGNFDNEIAKPNEPPHPESDCDTEEKRPAIASPYDGEIDQLRAEKRELEGVINNSSPARLRWLKVTRRISQDPHLDLHILHSTLEMKEEYRAREANSQPTGQMGTTRESAREFIEVMEDNGRAPNLALRAFADGLTDSYEFAEGPDATEELDEDIDIAY